MIRERTDKGQGETEWETKTKAMGLAQRNRIL
jgi:hypothetical protein